MDITMDKEQELIHKAKIGNQEAQEILFTLVQDLVFNLSLRMLGDIEDAKDACQEIYILVIKGLNNFRFESKFSTWAYRIAMNYLLREREKKNRFTIIHFDIYAQDNIPANLDIPYTMPEQVSVDDMAFELKLSCSNVMLQCLDVRDRAIYILGTMFQISSKMGADVMGITPAHYRKILSRVKQKMRDFLVQYCCVSGKCSCERRIGHAIRTHRLNPEQLSYFALPRLDKQELFSHVSYMQQLEDTSDFFAALPCYASTNLLHDVLKKIKENEQYEDYEYSTIS